MKTIAKYLGYEKFKIERYFDERNEQYVAAQYLYLKVDDSKVDVQKYLDHDNTYIDVDFDGGGANIYNDFLDGEYLCVSVFQFNFYTIREVVLKMKENDDISMDEIDIVARSLLFDNNLYTTGNIIKSILNKED